MADVTFQVLDGMERGLVYSDIPTPFTIGREDDNAVQLNDERVSRFHVKIQEDGDRVILTDLDSTNGTRVNGRPVQLHVLQIGDQLSIGRCLLLHGSPDQILERARQIGGDAAVAQLSDHAACAQPDGEAVAEVPSPENSFTNSTPTGTDRELFPSGPPPLLDDLPLVHQAQLCDLLAYMHDRVKIVLESAEEASARSKKEKPRIVDWVSWQQLMQLEMQLATYLREMAEPK